MARQDFDNAEPRRQRNQIGSRGITATAPAPTPKRMVTGGPSLPSKAAPVAKARVAQAPARNKLSILAGRSKPAKQKKIKKVVY